MQNQSKWPKKISTQDSSRSATPQPNEAESSVWATELQATTCCLQTWHIEVGPSTCTLLLHFTRVWRPRISQSARFYAFHSQQTNYLLPRGPHVSPQRQPLPFLIQLLLAMCPNGSKMSATYSFFSKSACSTSSVCAIAVGHSSFLHHCTSDTCPRCLEFFAEAFNHF